MGNTECCHVVAEDNYASQVVDTVQVINTKNQTPSVHNGPKEEQGVLPHPQTQQKVEKLHQPSLISIEVVEEDDIKIPDLANNIKHRVEDEQFFAEQLKGDLQVRRFGEEVYVGQLDEGNKYPHGWGKMYKADGSFYVGHFQHGKADGEGAYLTPDGLVYKGHFHSNNAQGEGKYQAAGLTYEGHFLKNLFHGEGKEGTASYEFDGEYYEGNKTHGALKWTDAKGNNFLYTGHFNFKNQFHGQGILTEPKGTYSGSFIDGLKDGKGIYKFTTGLRYEGDYSKGVKKGRGTIYNFNNSVAYEGEFDNDMPHGKGYVYDNNLGGGN